MPLRTIVAIAALALIPGCRPGGEMEDPAPGALPAPETDAAKISNAMSAAPSALAENATIVDWPERPGAEMRVLRRGTNEWTCMPANPATPGNDPMCLDPAFKSFMESHMSRTQPQTRQVGIGYMLQGGAEASNTDPFATEPAPGENWMASPPHVMMVVPDRADLEGLPTDHRTGGPWVMWAGTPYAHIMIPVES